MSASDTNNDSAREARTGSAARPRIRIGRFAEVGLGGGPGFETRSLDAHVRPSPAAPGRGRSGARRPRRCRTRYDGRPAYPWECPGLFHLLIPTHFVHAFRRMPPTDSDPFRPLISTQSVHRFRRISSTRSGRRCGQPPTRIPQLRRQNCRGLPFGSEATAPLDRPFGHSRWPPGQ